MGPVGSGKSTQARLLAKNLGISLFNAGDLLYYKSKEDGQENIEIRNKMEKGHLIDDKLVLSLVEKHLKEKEHRKGVVVDGFPRSLYQAENFSLQIDRVIYLKVSDEENKIRLLKRKRKDDKKDVIIERLAIYHKQTEPILKFYDSANLLLTIDGERAVKEISSDIITKLGKT